MKLSIYIVIFLLPLITSAQEKKTPVSYFENIKGDFLGQPIPDEFPALFAPGIISDGLSNRDVAVSPDGNEMYFGIHSADFKYSSIVFTQRIDGKWTKPEILPFAQDPRYVYLEPCLTPDGTKLFFLSNLPKDSSETPGDEDIWYVEKTNGEWGGPVNLGPPINTEHDEFYPSITEKGDLYFTRKEINSAKSFIYRGSYINGEYETPEKLPEQVNCGTTRFNAFVAPDESFIVVPALGRKDSYGGADYYIVFRNEDGSWREPLNMGDKINSSRGASWSFYQTLDQRAIFFMASKSLSKENLPETLSMDFFKLLPSLPGNGLSDIYWMDGKIIDSLKELSLERSFLSVHPDTIVNHPEAYENKKVEIKGLIKHICGVDGRKMKLVTPAGEIIKVIPHYILKPFTRDFYKKEVIIRGKVKTATVHHFDESRYLKKRQILCHIDHTPCKDNEWVENKFQSGKADLIIKKQIESLRKKTEKIGGAPLIQITIIAERVMIVE